jgi:uncharacterized delta-60 repeat protein
MENAEKRPVRHRRQEFIGWLSLALGCGVAAQAQWGAVDPAFQPGGGNNSGLDADVFAIAVQPDHKILIGGGFTKVGRTSRSRVARLQADGSLDTGFDPGAGVDGVVQVLIPGAEGRILIGGRFTTVQGQSRPYLARLTSTGGLDSSFDARPDGLVLAAVEVPGGGWVIGGSFTSVNGVPRAGLARLNREGVLDPEFNPGLDRAAHALAAGGDGSVWLAGAFSSVQGVSRSRVARWLAGGSLDPQFNPGAGPNEVVTAVTLQAGGQPVIGGAFIEYDGAPCWYLARLNLNGSVDSTFTPGIAPVWGGVLVLHADSASRVLVGGEFYTIDGVSRTGIARLQPNGVLDRTFDPGTGVANSDGFSPLVRALAVQPDGKVLIGGRFTSVNGVKLNYLARLTGDVSGPLEFQSIEPLATGRLRLTVSGPEGAVCVLEGSAEFGNWVPAQTNQVRDGSCVFETLDTIREQARFYRALRF